MIAHICIILLVWMVLSLKWQLDDIKKEISKLPHVTEQEESK